MASHDIITLQVDHLAREGRVLAKHVEVFLKYLLLVNGHIPHGYEDMRKRFSQDSAHDGESTKRAKRFMSAADELFAGLTNSICSSFVTEVVLVFGGTVFTPRFTVTVQLPSTYDPEGSVNDWNEIVDPSGFPIQLVQNFHRLSKAYDSPPSNIWLFIRVDERKTKEISPVFRIDRRASVSAKGHHLRVCLDLQPNPTSSSADCSGFYPLSPLPQSVGEILSSSALELSGIMPMSPAVPTSRNNLSNKNSTPARNSAIDKPHDLLTVYFTFVHCLKGFRS